MRVHVRSVQGLEPRTAEERAVVPRDMPRGSGQPSLRQIPAARSTRVCVLCVLTSTLSLRVQSKYPVGDYLPRQPEVTSQMREVLVEWMVSNHTHYIKHRKQQTADSKPNERHDRSR